MPPATRRHQPPVPCGDADKQESAGPAPTGRPPGCGEQASDAVDPALKCRAAALNDPSSRAVRSSSSCPSFSSKQALTLLAAPSPAGPSDDAQGRHIRYVWEVAPVIVHLEIRMSREKRNKIVKSEIKSSTKTNPGILFWTEKKSGTFCSRVVHLGVLQAVDRVF